MTFIFLIFLCSSLGILGGPLFESYFTKLLKEIAKSHKVIGKLYKYQLLSK